MRLSLLVSCAFLCIHATTSFGQDSNSTFNKVVDFPTKFLDKVDRKANSIEDKLVDKTEQVLKRIEKEEARLKQKLAKIDSSAAAQIFASSQKKLEQLREGLKKASSLGGDRIGYIPYLDTLKTSLSFLTKYKVDQGLSDDRVNDALASVKNLDSRLQHAEVVRKYLKERRQYLKEQLGRFGFVKELKRYNKEVYYYAEQIKEYKNILQDQEKLEKTALGLLSKLPVFQNFLKQHSEFASMFGMPGNGSTVPSAQLTGMQTRGNIQQLIQQNLGVTGPNVQNMIQQNMQQGQTQLNQLKDQLINLGGVGGNNSADFEMPDFKPNSQKTKMFWDRIEYGTNIQTVKATAFWPVTIDLGLQAGYKLNDGAEIGVGISYKIGMGKDIRSFEITHQGIGLRSYIDWKLKGKLYVSGGYEQNYRTEFDNIQQLKDNPQNWQQSGLIGISRQYKVGKKIKGDMKLLFDFLYQSQHPNSPPILFRLGYKF